MRRNYSPRYVGITGRDLEQTVLGSCKAQAHGKMTFYAASKLVRNANNQPFDPHRPTGEARRLRDAVAKEMGIEPVQLGIYTAVGSNLDYNHGVDGFFAFNGLVVTLDVTMCPEHKPLRGADVLISHLDVETGYGFVAREVNWWFNHHRGFRKGMVTAS